MFSASKTAGPSGYNIANSLRFRSSASAYLSRTPSVAGNRQTWTWSGWVKRGALSIDARLFTAWSANNDNGWFSLAFTTSNVVEIQIWNAAVATSAVFRDPSSWYHIVLAVDTTQATASNRVLFYVNGVSQPLVTSAGTGINGFSQNLQTAVNNSVAHTISAFQNAGLSSFTDGYLADINFIDGQALTPSSFGVIDTLTGVWKPIAYSGSYGTNGFHLNFSNGTSTTTLGYDSSGNGNNWTTNNISLTAGSTYDWMIDSPTKYPGSSYGVGNYAVFNPLDVSFGTLPTLSNGNLQADCPSTANRFVNVSIKADIKTYCEITCNSSGTSTANLHYVGIQTSAGQYFYSASSGNFYNNGSWISYGATYTTNDVIGIAIDPTGLTIEFYKNGTTQGSKSITGSSVQILASLYNPSTTSSFIANFGQRPFAYTPPSGYKSLCTQNLPGVTIQNGAAYMAATTYTGTAGTQAISNSVNGVSFQPGFVWIKNRGSGTASHVLQDSVRGNYEYLQSNATAAENTNSGYDWFKSFDASGFTVAATSSNGTSTSEWNSAGYTYIGWQWKAGGTAVTNTAGSITSQVSANTTSGFAVVTYSGNSTVGATVGHGLGVAPSMIIFKSRNTAGTSWDTYHVALGATKYLLLDSTAAAGTSSWLNNTAPSSSVITLSNFGDTNQSGSTYVAYCFAAIPGYSAFGSYTGNGSTDGPFVYCGFRPRYILIKKISAAGSWVIMDSSRNPYNQVNFSLNADYFGSEDSIYAYEDFLANGVKLRTTDGAWNASGGTYIYAAFAENPFQNALAR